ncbi:hypothetical protein [Actinacidiphila acididurans]|uniref:Uncharacterized protein n=1 Tax=Actinacidiphila acididurans TaxID=2784346 RepID=A0ABS2U5I7_9ACTN|nr:hypothetical protein [Actinacidiphila acididurans]MBM9509981.1 hypothetical protein [Actinacidiphila acididurans]
MTDPAPDPLAPTPDAPAEPTAPPCGYCGGPSAVHWARRLTADEIAAEQAKEQARRNEATALADPDGPEPIWPPLPDCLDYVHAVYGCLTHYITQDAAAHIHGPGCTAPRPELTPGCDCTPEPLPEPEPEPTPPPLPPGWT